MKIDVKHFFLSGSLVQLVKDCQCRQTWPGEKGKLMEDILYFLLDSQFIKSDIIDGIWQVKMGTGMGLKHSGELTDWIFYNAIEKEWNINEHVVNHHHILQQWRFRDDILVLAGDRQKAKEFFWGMKARSQYFALEVETFSSRSVVYLETFTRKDGDRFRISPHFKPTNLGIPLSPESAHPAFVHASWPLVAIKRLRALSSTASDAENARRIIINRFKKTPRQSCID